MPTAKPAAILLVEDNAAMAENLVEILEGEGYTVRTAATAAAAREAARRGFHLALVDVRLPDGEGTQLAGELKASAPGAETILLTGYATVESAIAAVRAGAWAYLVKPVAPADLLVAVGQAVRQVALLEEKEELTRRAQLAEKLAAIGAMAAGLAHEVRNPLNAAQLQLQIAVRRVERGTAEDLARALEAITLVRSELERLNGTVDEVLAFARPSRLLVAPCDLRETLRALCTLVGPELEGSKIRLHLGAPPAPVVVRCDEGRIKQVLLNLVRNAREAAGEGGEVGVDLRDLGASVELEVEDTGPGLPEGFDPFQPFSTTKAQGTGLGLATVQRIVVDHSGSIAVGRRGGRTVFTVRLPSGGPAAA